MKLRLLSKKNETPDVISFTFQPPELITWKAGQFFHYVLHHRPTDDRGSDRWFTISSAPFENVVMITTRISNEKGSSFKKELNNLVVEDTIEISDVDGEFIVEDLSQEYVFIAGGIGITPFHSILKQLDHEGKHPAVTLLYANRDQNIVYKDELEALTKNNPLFQIHYVFSPEHIDEKKIKEFVPDLQKPIFYVSGPEPMVLSLYNELKGIGIPENHLKKDSFPGYPEDK